MEKIPTVTRVVAVALIDQHGRVLMQKRKATAQHGGLWEFPGGKIEPGESPESALVREIAEELGIAVAVADLADEGEVEEERSPQIRLVLKLYSCRRWCGVPRCLAGEAIAWFDPAAAALLSVPPLDRPFLARLATIVAAARGERA